MSRAIGSPHRSESSLSEDLFDPRLCALMPGPHWLCTEVSSRLRFAAAGDWALPVSTSPWPSLLKNFADV